ncbi:ABC transporter permease [Mesomycoplasma neurolyticum]|uniref:ABC-type uncharacterized transport system, permease component n=1 Tax=Mesomycoplasma neurolyticum TaxID=2120 RepID=A0A449A582_9BACT|nr:ABC transporter permease [Mesomycoplasma neurolyticum]VEU59450.1 ABC-type uncharacterized transport system, permease component [Mesomycoplasma neurolyticum]
MTKNLVSESWKKFTTFFCKEEKITTRRKVFNSLWAILFGVIISSIFIASIGVSPFSVLHEIYTTSISLQKNKFIITIAVFIFSSIAVGIAFKASMFNIGIPGQMMASGIISFAVIGELSKMNNPDWYILVLAFVLGVLTSLVLGMLSGILKAFLNVNEVVSTILLNWIIFYIISGILKKSNLSFVTNSASASGAYSTEKLSYTNFISTEYFAYIILILAIFFAFLMWFVFKSTTFGYKIKMIGLNKDATRYSGANSKALIVTALTLSGTFAGIAGFLWYILAKYNLALSIGPEALGFDAIAVSLLAYNSPLGSIFTSIFYSFLTTGSFSLQILDSRLDSFIVQIATGLIIYLAAISVIFTKFKPIEKLTRLYFLIKSKYFFVENRKMYKNILINKKNNLLHILNEELSNKEIDLKYKNELENQIWNLEHLLELNKTSIFKSLKKQFYLSIQSNKQYFINIEKQCYIKNNKDSNFNTNIDKKIAKNLKNNIKFLEKENLIYIKYINFLTLLIKWKLVPIFQAKTFISCKLYKKYRKSKLTLNLINAENKPKWKELKNQLKNSFYNKATKNLTDEQKLELFWEMSEKRKSVNKQLLENGYEDQKILKETYKVEKNDLKNTYLKSKQNIYKSLNKSKLLDWEAE